MFTFPVTLFSKDEPVTSIFTDSYEGARASSSISATVDIGAAPATGKTRHVLISVFISEPSPTTILTFSIGGLTTTKLVEDTTGADGGGAVYIAEVPTGTTISISGTMDKGANYCGGVVYSLYDLKSATPVNTTFAITESTVVSSGGISETNNGALIAMAGYWPNTSSTYTWSGTSGVVEDFDGGVSGTNELFASSASKASTTSATGLTVTGTATNFSSRGHRLFVLEMR